MRSTMEYRQGFLLLLLAALCSGQDDKQPLTVSILGSTRRMEMPGVSMNLTCQLNQGLPIILSHTIKWLHVSLANRGQPVRKELTSQETLTGNASPDNYDIEVQHNNSHVTAILTISEVKSSTDGIFTCQVMANKDPSDMETKDVHVIVCNDVEDVTLQFDGEESIRGEVNADIEREEGTYGVTCTARGFNPGAEISIYVGDQEQETGGTEIRQDQQASNDAGARRYQATATATNVDLRSMHSSQRLICEAKGDFEGATPMRASVPLLIIALEPEVTCEKNASARPGQMYFKLSCLVRHDNIQIEGYSWEIGDTGEVIRIGESNDNYHEIIVQDFGNGSTKVTLDLYKVEEVHFETYLYLDIFTKSGQNFRTKATLIRLDPNTGSASQAVVALWACLLSVAVSVFNAL